MTVETNYRIGPDGRPHVKVPVHEAITATERPSGLEWARSTSPVVRTADGNYITAAPTAEEAAETCSSCGYVPSRHRGGKSFSETGGRCTQCRSDQRTLGPVPDERRGRMARARAFSGQANERDIVDLVNDEIVGPAAYAAVARAAADEADRELGELLEAVEADLANDPGERLVALANDWQQRFGQSARQSVDL